MTAEDGGTREGDAIGDEDQARDGAGERPPESQVPGAHPANHTGARVVPRVAEPDVPLPGPIRRLYDWVLSWAYTPYGLAALVILCFAEASVFPIPPDPLLMALCLGAPALSFRFAAWATGASVAGGVLGYSLGWGAWALLDDFFFGWVPGVTPEAFASVQGLYAQYDFWAVFLAGLTPLPYKVFTLSAGVFAISFPIFVVASIMSRGLRFFLVAALIWKFGPPVSRFIDRYFNLLTVAFGVLLVLGFLAITWLL